MGKWLFDLIRLFLETLFYIINFVNLFLLLFMGLTTLLILFMSLIYSTFNKKISVLVK